LTSDTAAAVQPAPQVSAETVPRTTTLLFAFTSFLSAFLLFQVQLIISKHILPWFGGSAAVWTTSLLVFQLLLLAGYVYSHVVSVRLSPIAQARLHSLVLALAFLLVLILSFFWPSAITPGPSWKPLSTDSPAAAVAAIVLLSVGLPFFVLSTTAPLLQGWFARLGGGARAYRLYSLSNLGSLLGLLSFPLLVEPTLHLKLQGRIWTIAFCLFAGGCVLCAWRAMRAPDRQPAEPTDSPVDCPEACPRPLLYGLWFLLPACASSLLLATTNLLCQEVITVPLLWVLPLSLYLLSFILCFDHPRWYQRAVFHPLFAAALFLTFAALAFVQFLVLTMVLPLLLFFTCMICHGELVRLKPGVRSLTSFYLVISAGGAAGGIFVAVVAPHVFRSFLEFQLSLGLAIILWLVTLLLDPDSWLFRRRLWLPLVIVVATLLAGFGAGRWLPAIADLLDSLRFYPVAVFIGITAVMAAVMLERGTDAAERGFRSVQIPVGALILFAFAALYFSSLPKGAFRWGARSFYGVVRVFRYTHLNELVHGQTSHGTQLDPPMERYPTAYYGPISGIGVLLRNHPSRNVAGGTLRMGVVGLGVGTLAAYGHHGDSIRFYEINPDVVSLCSGEHPLFTYLRDSPATVSLALGDARLSLEREAAAGARGRFDVLVLDAFNGDSVPVHLLTKEAFETYWQQLDPQTGIIAVHITSRHVDLVPVLQGAAAHFHAQYLLTWNQPQAPVYGSAWFLITRHPELLNIPGLQPITVQYRGVAPRLWTDDYSDILRLIY